MPSARRRMFTENTLARKVASVPNTRPFKITMPHDRCRGRLLAPRTTDECQNLIRHMTPRGTSALTSRTDSIRYYEYWHVPLGWKHCQDLIREREGREQPHGLRNANYCPSETYFRRTHYRRFVRNAKSGRDNVPKECAVRLTILIAIVRKATHGSPRYRARNRFSKHAN